MDGGGNLRMYRATWSQHHSNQPGFCFNRRRTVAGDHW